MAFSPAEWILLILLIIGLLFLIGANGYLLFTQKQGASCYDQNTGATGYCVTDYSLRQFLGGISFAVLILVALMIVIYELVRQRGTNVPGAAAAARVRGYYY
jgi:hypothetical protein